MLFWLSDELLRREYPLEEFLWTGSGEGPDRDEGQISWVTTTVFKTTTKLVATPVSASFTLVTAAVCPGEQQPCITPCKQPNSRVNKRDKPTWSTLKYYRLYIVHCNSFPHFDERIGKLNVLCNLHNACVKTVAS